MNFNIPEYINFYKFLLIEEIVFADNPALIHYGKCSVIGYLDNFDCIQSISIQNIEKEYQLPDCALSLKIHCEFHPKKFLHSTVQIYGEIRVIDKNLDVTVKNFESSRSLIHKLRELQISLETQEGKQREPTGTNDKNLSLQVRIRLEKEINHISERYIPIIYVHDIRFLPSAREVIYENLQYRQIRENIDNL